MFLAPPNLPMIAIDNFRHILLLEDDTTFITEVDIKIGSCKSLYGSTKCCQFGLMGTSSSLLRHFVSLLSIIFIACVRYFCNCHMLSVPSNTQQTMRKPFFEKTQRTFAFHFMVKVQQASQEVSGTESYKLRLAGKTTNRVVR